jgi:hypothetical protein
MSELLSDNGSSPVTLDRVSMPFFSGLQSLRDFIFSVFAGLSMVKGNDLEVLESGLEPFFKRPEGLDHAEIVRLARLNLFKMALAEIRKLNTGFYSELRNFLEYRRIGNLELGDEQKTKAFSQVLSQKIDSPIALSEELSKLLSKGFGLSRELGSLESFLIFLSQGPVEGGSADTISLHLFRAEIEGDASGILKPTLKVMPVERIIKKGDLDQLDADLLKEIFFTPYAIALNLLKFENEPNK